jgi:AraC-like DNA-binding protein
MDLIEAATCRDSGPSDSDCHTHWAQRSGRLGGIDVNAGPKPLDAYSLVRTSDIGETQVAVARFYGQQHLRLRPGARGFFAYVNHRALRSIGLSFASYGTGVVQEFPAFDAFAQQFWMAGSAQAMVGGTAVAVTPRQSPVVSPETRLSLTCAADFEQCVLRIDRQALLNKVVALTDAPLRHDLTFDPVADLGVPTAQHVRRLFMFLADQPVGADCAIPPLALAELEQSIMVSFLCGNRHNHSHLLDHTPARAAPWQVRRAEEYIEANWDQPITVEALSAATGANPRSIFHVFKESRGYSPMAFVKQVRLRQSRRMLMMPDADASVTTVAIACGFSNLGRFSKDYDRMFGELPSVTLNRAKGCRHQASDPPDRACRQGPPKVAARRPDGIAAVDRRRPLVGHGPAIAGAFDGPQLDLRSHRP